jgi:hypothetical protein
MYLSRAALVHAIPTLGRPEERPGLSTVNVSSVD